MTAAYRLKGIGWFVGCVAIVLGFYLVSLQVAAERKKLDGVNDRIHAAERDIRALETEFDTRANLAQLEKWNGDTLALAAPTAGQFVASEAALASIDVNRSALPGAATVQTAALVVPSMPTQAVPVATAAPAVIRVAASVPASASAPTARPQLAQVAATIRLARPAPTLAVTRVASVEKSAPMMAKLTDAARGAAAVARVRPQAVAMLDRKLLSDSTLGDILKSARTEARLR